jgi:hypothetical protein
LSSSAALSDPHPVGSLFGGWVEKLLGPSEREHVAAWGKEMAVELTYSVAAVESPPPRLADLRAALLARYAQSGPVFA